MGVLSYWTIKTKKENVSDLCLCVDTVYWPSSYILLKRKNLSYILDFFGPGKRDIGKNATEKISLTTIDTKHVEKEEVSNCIQAMSWLNLFYIFKTKTRKQKQTMSS